MFAVLAAGGLSAAASCTAAARARSASRESFFYENARLKLISESSATLVEQGRAAGTYDAVVSCTIHIQPGHVTARYTISPRGGSVSGHAIANYRNHGTDVFFGGKLQITRATGRFRHTSGKNINFSGWIEKDNGFRMVIKVSGWIKR